MEGKHLKGIVIANRKSCFTSVMIKLKSYLHVAHYTVFLRYNFFGSCYVR